MRALSNGCRDGDDVPPAGSSVTITCAPRGTRTFNLVVPPLKVPAGRIAGDATHASYVFPFGGFGRAAVSTASPDGATTN